MALAHQTTRNLRIDFSDLMGRVPADFVAYIGMIRTDTANPQAPFYTDHVVLDPATLEDVPLDNQGVGNVRLIPSADFRTPMQYILRVGPKSEIIFTMPNADAVLIDLLTAGQPDLLPGETPNPPTTRAVGSSVGRVIARSTPLAADTAVIARFGAVPGVVFAAVPPFLSSSTGRPEHTATLLTGERVVRKAQPYAIGSNIRIHPFTRHTLTLPARGLRPQETRYHRGDTILKRPDFDYLLGWWVSSWRRTGVGDDAVDMYLHSVPVARGPAYRYSAELSDQFSLLWTGLPAVGDGTLVAVRYRYEAEWNQLDLQGFGYIVPAGVFFQFEERVVGVVYPDE